MNYNTFLVDFRGLKTYHFEHQKKRFAKLSKSFGNVLCTPHRPESLSLITDPKSP